MRVSLKDRKLPSDSVDKGVQQKLPSGVHDPRTTQAIQKFCRYALSLMDRKPNEEPSAYYKASRLIDAFVKTERTNGASSPGCIVVGTIV